MGRSEIVTVHLYRESDAMSSQVPVLLSLSNRLKNRAALGVLGLLFGLLSVLLWGLPGAVLAQEDSLKEFQVQAGAYRITVIADPSRHALGTVLYTITVVNSDNGQPVSDAEVTINFRREAEGTGGPAFALNEPSAPSIYKATVQLESADIWHTSVEVDSPLGRVEVETPAVTIPEPRQTRSGSLVFIGAFLAILSGVAYLVWSSRKAIKAREAASES